MPYFQPVFTNGINSAPDYSSDPFVNGYPIQIASTGATTFTIGPGAARAYTTDFAIIFNGIQPAEPPLLTLDITTVGLLGCFPYAIVPGTAVTGRTTYNVYVLGDTTGVNATTAIVGTGNNFLPKGYDVWRKIGSVFVETSNTTLMNYTQAGTGIERTYVLQESSPGDVINFASNFNVFNCGHNGRPCNPFFTTEVCVSRSITAGSAGNWMAISPTNMSAGGRPIFTLASPAAGAELRDEVWCPVTIVAPNNVVYVSVNGAGTTTTTGVLGWKEYMGLNAV